MANLRKHIKKMMRTKLSGNTMELLIGLNEENELQLRKMTERFSKKLVTAYFSAIKKQSRQAAKAKSHNHGETTSVPVAYLEPAVIAS